MTGSRINLSEFQNHVKSKSPAFVPLFRDKSRYQIAWGGAGCVHPETRIHTEFGLMRICDIDRPMRVLSWNEKSQRFQLSLSGGSFPKGRGNLYRVTTSRGVFESSGHHLVLLSTGEYQRVDSLSLGDELNQAQKLHDQTIEESCLSGSCLDAQRYSKTDADYLRGYAELCRQYDPLPHEKGDYALFSETLQDGAQVFDRSCLTSRYEIQGKSQSSSRPCLCGDLSCKIYCGAEGLYSGAFSEGCSVASSFVRTSCSRQVPQQSQMTNEHHHKEVRFSNNEQVRVDPLVDSYHCPYANGYNVLSSAAPVESIDIIEESEYWCMQVLDTNNYVCEGGFVHHNSGKSHIVARKLIYRMLQEDYVKHNILIIRKVDRTIKKSVWTLMKNIISKWGLYDEFDFNQTDRTMIWRKNGSQFMFSGLDDVEKLKSIEGVTSIWCEEATELIQEDFEQLDLRLRGEHGCLKQITLTLNPISDQHWIKKIFFDDPISGVFTLKTTYLDNAFIDDEYKMVMENKRKSNPRYYNIYALGNWGTADGLIFERVENRFIRPDEIVGLECVQGLDFGYTNDPTAFHESYIDLDKKVIFIYDGFYEKGMSNEAIAAKIIEMKKHKHQTVADSSEPKSIDRLSALGVKVIAARKGKDSVNTGIDFLLDFSIVVNSHLVEFNTEFNNYSWSQDKNGKSTNKPVDEFNHFIDSLRYSTEKFQAASKNIGMVFARRRR